MRILPWVSRRAFDVVVDERDRLRERVDGLIGELVRLARKESGLPERAPDQRAPRKPTPLPTELRNLISGFSDPTIQAQLEHEARNALRTGTPEAEIVGQLRRSLGVEA